jgi:membrane protease YdiL (CAAX protease family)
MWGTPCTGGGTISWSYLPAVIAVVVCALVYSKMLASRAGAAPSSDQAEFLTDLVHNVLNIGRHAVPLVLFAQVFTGAFVEEVAFRLGVQNFFARQLHLRRWRYGAAIIGAAALWSLLHAGFVGPGYVKFIQLFPLGVALGFLFRRYGVESCILAHGTFDLAWLYWGLR